MSEIFLQPVSLLTVPRHARDIWNLVQDHQAELEQARPGVAQRYAERGSARQSLAKAAMSRTINTHVLYRGDAIHKKGEAVGLATLIKALTLQCSDKQVTGTSLDYWGLGLTPEEHGAAFAALQEEAGNVDLVAVLTEQEQKLALGVVDGMHPVGALGRVLVPTGLPDYGLNSLEVDARIYILPAQQPSA